MTEYQMKDFESGKYPLLFSPEILKQRIKELAAEIASEYHDKCPVLIGVLNGAFMFLSDLVKELKIDCEVDFIKISSYGNERTSTGQIKVKKDIDCHIEDRHVLVVEDIVDSGLSVQYLENRLMAYQPKSLKFVSLLRKKNAAKVSFNIDYLGFWIENEFVVGYGLDLAQKLRNLPAVYILK